MGALLPARVPRHLRRRPGPLTAARWTAQWLRGTASVALRYPFEVVPPTRRRSPEVHEDPPPTHAGHWPGDLATIQPAHEGVGPLFHRRYWVDVRGATLDAEELIALVLEDPNAVAPPAIGKFVDGDGHRVRGLRLGDECVVALPGPWNAPVRVVDVAATSLTLATMTGHIEAGQIEFRAHHRPDRATLRFEIESWARSSAGLLHLLYDVVPLARELQLVMWSRMCRNVVDVAGGTAPHGVQVTTERRPWPPLETP